MKKYTCPQGGSTSVFQKVSVVAKQCCNPNSSQEYRLYGYEEWNIDNFFKGDCGCEKCGWSGTESEFIQPEYNLSKKQIETLLKLRKHKSFIRYDGGFWSWNSVEIKHLSFNKMDDLESPVWWCDIKTLRALSKYDLVILDEENKICNYREKGQ